MSVFARDFTDISVENNSLTVQINNTESNFAVAPGSRLFLIGFLPVAVASSDSTARTLTLEKPWPNATQTNVAASVIPIGLGDWLLTALENNRLAYEAFVTAIDGQEEPLTEVRWENILAETLPAFVKRWAKYSEITDKPEYAQGYPSFDKVTGKVSKEQLPEGVETDSTRTLGLSPPVKVSPSLAQTLVDYPTLKSTKTIPVESPNNRRLILFDDIRGLVHIALTDRWLTVPQNIESRFFALFYQGLTLTFNAAYSGSITLKVYPMGNGGKGLPLPEDEDGDPIILANFEWHTITTTVTNLAAIGELDGDRFEGIIDSVALDNAWATLDVDQSSYPSLNAYFERSSGNVSSPFKRFYRRYDDYWYSEDLTPVNPYYMGSSWAQDAEDFRSYTVTSADGGTDALRFFGDGSDDYEMEIILTANMSNRLALTVSNSAPWIIYYAGTERHITNERIYFKRTAGFLPITGTVRVESIRMRVKVNG